MSKIAPPILGRWGDGLIRSRMFVPAHHLADMSAALYGARTISELMTSNHESFADETGDPQPFLGDNVLSGLSYALTALIDHIESHVESIKASAEREAEAAQETTAPPSANAD